ncbi:3-keto-5-aminohexanoate cleavage protein [Mycobacterium triplex]|uniref:3-keto-5-aminohexanoate cleavage protein n=1 Tax=Mycobacterium triplex TaxID=47839 RepID=UPI00387E2642
MPFQQISHSNAGAAASEPVIIEGAINGATSNTVHPNVPVTGDEIVADALSCFGVGAAIVSAYPLRRPRRSGRIGSTRRFHME